MLVNKFRDLLDHRYLRYAPAVLVGLAVFGVLCSLRDKPPIRIGVLASATGTMAISEKNFADAIQLAVDEINADGGVLNRQVEIVVADPQSIPERHATEARRFLDDGVDFIFSRAISASRKELIPVVEQENALLIYTMQYEGIEQSPNTIYLGAAPNQQIVPALRWAIKTEGRRFFLVGSDYVFPRTAHEIIHDYANLWQAEIVGEAFLPLGTRDVEGAVEEIARSKPDVILSTLNGDSNVYFFTALRQAGIQPDEIPTISFSVGEQELETMNPSNMAGDYAAWTYSQSLSSRRNLEFVERFKRKFGRDRVTSDPIETSYASIHLWAQAVEIAGSLKPAKVKKAMLGLSGAAPGGMLHVDAENQHAWKTTRICKITAEGQLEIVWDSGNPLRPEPFPPTRSHKEWEKFLQDLHDSWGGQWAAPQSKS